MNMDLRKPGERSGREDEPTFPALGVGSVNTDRAAGGVIDQLRP